MWVFFIGISTARLSAAPFEKPIVPKQNKTLVVIDDHYSPAEVFSALVESIIHFKSLDYLPENVKRQSPLGPLLMPINHPETSRISYDQAFDLALYAKVFIRLQNTLPHWLMIDERRIGTGSLLALFSEMFLAIKKETLTKEFVIPSFDAHPVDNLEAIVKSVEGCKSWPVHREDLDMEHIIEMTKMQMWTLKPAQRAEKDSF